VQTADPLGLVGEGDAFFSRPIDLDVGRVQVDRRARRCELLAALLGQGSEPTPHAIAHCLLEVGEDRLVEVLGLANERLEAGTFRSARSGAPATSRR
jgi:hypothetical protein